MPKAFSDREKETIRRQLHEQGQRLFALHGVKKTSVDDLTQAVGISKGAFYLFYASKEELLLEILEKIEAELRTGILGYTIRPDVEARENVRAMLSHFLLMWDAYPLLKNFSKADFEYLVRKLPAERVQAHGQQDEAFIQNFIEKNKREGITFHVSAHVVISLIKSLFFIGLHHHDLGELSGSDGNLGGPGGGLRHRRGMMNYAIQTDGLSKFYGKVRAVDGVNLRVRLGEIY